VGVIGVGKAGSVLGAALRRAGHPVVGVYAVSDLSLVRAEALLPGAPVVSMQEVFAGSDLVLLTVPDDVLGELVESFAREGWIRPGQFLVHCSGRYGTGVLDPATAAGALPLALHPVMTLTGTSLDLDRLSGCPFGVTAPESLLTVASALVVEMGGEPMVVAEDKRALYHAALAYSANHMITLASDAMQLLSAAGVGTPELMLRPLLSASLDNALERGDAALTGPVSRGDATTVSRHLVELSQESEQLAEVYRTLARRTAERALAAGTLSPDDAQRLLAVLAGPAGST